MTGDGSLIWADASTLLAAEVSDAVWNSTFKEVQASDLTDSTITLVVPSQLVRQRIETRYTQLLGDALAESGHGTLRVVLEVRIDHAEPPLEVIPSAHKGEVDERTTTHRPVSYPTRPVNADPSSDGSDIHDFHPTDARFTFESFVIGPTNRFAHAAALGVAEKPGLSYNPLFVYGSAGLGKTHLLLAIANYVREVYPAFKIRYISMETMMNEFVEAIRQNSQSDFKRRLRGIDVLLVDDIQFMEGKEQLQDEFFHTFNSLQQAQKQVVLSSDRPPDAINTLEDRLRSRFKQGLITDIQPPDFETRLAILQKKRERSSTWVPDDILEFIATHITYNIRELEGAMTKVCAYTSLYDVELDLDVARDVLADSISSSQSRPITAAVIIEKAAEFFGLDVDQIRGKSRTRDLVHARQVGMYVCRTETELSYPQIGREFGGRDHTTVMHAFEKISALMSEREKTFEDVRDLTNLVRSRD